MMSCLYLNSQTIVSRVPDPASLSMPAEHCATTSFTDLYLRDHPLTHFRTAQIESDLYSRVQMMMQDANARSQTLHTIPVVVHIVHNNGQENIPNSQVHDALRHLNDAFANTGFYDPNTGVTTDIEFCLATRDQNGAYTNGINRVHSGLTNVIFETQDLALKNLSRWNPNQYLNIWVVREVISANSGFAIQAYASMPVLHGLPQDGIVIEAGIFGSSQNNSKVLVHEAGHFLGLYHTFEGGCLNNNCMTQGDRVCDTPPDASVAPIACTASINTCTTDDDDLSSNNPFRPFAYGGIGDRPDMIQNYMDYSNLSCQSMFTRGQVDRMRATLEGTRLSLLQSMACNTLCQNPLNAQFSASATSVPTGSTVSFTNTSTGGGTYEWQINGVTASTSQHFSHQFNTPGQYEVKLFAFNNDPNCLDEYAMWVTVSCNAVADISASATSISPGTVINFQNNSQNASGYVWMVDGNAESSAPVFQRQFMTPGGYTVQLIATDGNCSDTSRAVFIQVGNCDRLATTNTWYFGQQAGLDFNTGNPIPLMNSGMVASEGAASISDASGAIQFYTNGVSVWNRNHVTMPNGTGLMGHTSASQGALIVPKPATFDKFYVITTDAVESILLKGLRYSVVDMSLDGGMGDLIPGQKNISLGDSMAEKITASFHENFTDYWVVAHGAYSDRFYAYLITPQGIDSVPVISDVGLPHVLPTGCMKISPNGKKLAISLNAVGKRGVEIFDFDPATGIVSNPITILTAPLDQVHGIEFSPDNSKLYFSTFTKIYQVDLAAGSPNDIINSNTLVQTSGIVAFYTLQRASNGKIYIATNSQFLDCIDAPNQPAMNCNYQYHSVALGKYSMWSLPNFVVSYLVASAVEVVGPDSICTTGGQVSYQAAKEDSSDAMNWELRGTSTMLTGAADTTVLVQPGLPGVDTLICSRYSACGVSYDTTYIHVFDLPTIDLGADTTLCVNQTMLLDPGSGFANYQWSTGATSPTLTISAPGMYAVTVSNLIGCGSIDSIKITSLNPAPPTVDLGPDTAICGGGVFALDAGPGNYTYEWQDGSTSQQYTVFASGNYSVTVSNECGVTAIDTIIVTLTSGIIVDLGPDTMLCGSNSIPLNAGAGHLYYMWSTGHTGPIFNVSLPGTYWVEVSDSFGCSERDTIVVHTCVGNAAGIGSPTLQVFPNPNAGAFGLLLEGLSQSEPVAIDIVNALGQQVYTQMHVPVAGRIEHRFELTELRAGMYFLRVRLEDGWLTRRIEVRR